MPDSDEPIEFIRFYNKMSTSPYYTGRAHRRLHESFNATARREAAFAEIRRAIEAQSAEDLRLAVARADEDRVAINRETVWRLAAMANNAELLEALWTLDEERRDVDTVIIAAWQGAIMADAGNAIVWLDHVLRPGVSLDATASLAALALKYNPELARVLIQPVRDMPTAQQVKKDRLLIDYLHAAAANGRDATLADILSTEFVEGQRVFAPETTRYQAIVQRAVTADQPMTVAVLLRQGQGYLSDAQLDALLVAACDHGLPRVAGALTSVGASPLALQGAALKHVARHLGEMAPTAGAEAPARVLADIILAAGANADALVAAVGRAARDEKNAATLMDEVTRRAEAAAYVHLLSLRRLPAARDRSQRLQPMSYLGRHEGLLHRAARHRVLAPLLAEGVLSPLSVEDWRAKNSAGQSVMDLALASGATTTLLQPEAWQNHTAALRAFLTVLPDEALPGPARVTLMQHVQQQDDRARAARRKYRL